MTPNTKDAVVVSIVESNNRDINHVRDHTDGFELVTSSVDAEASKPRVEQLAEKPSSLLAKQRQVKMIIRKRLKYQVVQLYYR